MELAVVLNVPFQGEGDLVESVSDVMEGAG